MISRALIESMKQKSKLPCLSTKPNSFLVCSHPFSFFSIESFPAPSSEPRNVDVSLTEEEIAKINLLIPRLCLSNRLPTAIRLLDAALLANPPLRSLSLSILIDSLASLADMTQPMSFLNRLKHNPRAEPYLNPIYTMLIASYFKREKHKEALKVFNWMLRPGYPCKPDEKVCGILVTGFCRKWLVVEALEVLRYMVWANLVPGEDLRKWVYRGLLREARVREALELNKALACLVRGNDGGEGLKKVVALLDQILANWAQWSW